MPTNHVSADKLSVRGKSGGKHWTKSEVESRKRAADGMQRKKRVMLRIPDWLSPEAQKVWHRVRRQIVGLNLLDNLDAEMLAIYCDAVANYQMTTTQLVIENDKGEMVSNEEVIKAAQAWSRIIAAYADKLGFTPAARARLVKRKADEIQDDFGAAFD